MKNFSLLIFLLIGTISSAQPDSVLFLGNSYTAGNNLATMFDNLSQAAGDTFFVESATQGGFTIQSHLNNAGHLAKIRQRAWKYYIVQEQSQVPTIDHYFNTLSLPAARSLETYARQQNNCSEIIFFMTWGRRFGGQQCDQNNVHCSVNFTDFDHMQDTLKSRYIQLAQDIGGGTSPVGEAWRIALSDTSDLVLHTGDNSHPNLLGSYLAACTHYASLTGKSPVGVSYTAGVNATWANYLQRKAAEAVLDSMTVFGLDTAQYPNFEFRIDASSYISTHDCQLDSLPVSILSYHQGKNPVGDSIPVLFKQWTVGGQLLKIDTVLFNTPAVCRKSYDNRYHYVQWQSDAYYLTHEIGLSGLNAQLTNSDTIAAFPFNYPLDSISCYRENFNLSPYLSNRDRWAYTQSGASILGWNLNSNVNAALNQTKPGGEYAVLASFDTSWTQYDLFSPCFDLPAGNYVVSFNHANNRLDPNSGAAFKLYLHNTNRFGNQILLHDFGLRYDSLYQSFSDTFTISQAGYHGFSLQTYGSMGTSLIGIDDFEVKMVGSQCQQVIHLEEALLNSLQLYPNPARDYFILEHRDLKLDPSKLSIFDQLGRKQSIQIEILSAHQLKLRGLKAGLFILLIEGPNGAFLQKKILVQAEQ